MNHITLQVKSSLLRHGIYDHKTYFHIWKNRIVGWVAIGAVLGLAYGGIGWALAGAVAGMAMPVLLLYLWFAMGHVAAYLAGYFVGVALAALFIWAFFRVLIGW